VDLSIGPPLTPQGTVHRRNQDGPFHPGFWVVPVCETSTTWRCAAANKTPPQATRLVEFFIGAIWGIITYKSSCACKINH
jgi:hypothetical protein